MIRRVTHFEQHPHYWNPANTTCTSAWFRTVGGIGKFTEDRPRGFKIRLGAPLRERPWARLLTGSPASS